MTQMYKVDSPINREQRNNLNLTFADILKRFTNLQRQISILAGDEEIDEWLVRIEQAVSNSETTAVELNSLLSQVNTKLNQMQTAINNANTATSNANTARTNANNAATAANTAATNASNATASANNAVATANTAKDAANTATQNANVATANANTATSNANTATDKANIATQNATNATTLANDAKNKALKAVQDVIDAITDMQADLQAYMDTFVHLNTYQAATQYYKNNEVLHMGSTWRAKQDTLGNPPPNDFTVLNDANWQLVARRGDDAPSESDRLSVWRGATPPANTTMIWWHDPNFVVGEEIYIYRGNVPPTDTKQLWLAPRGV